MPKTESKYAPKLRELGFTPIEKEVSLAVRAEWPRKLSRQERRKLERMRYRPWFTMTLINTLATDDTGQSWVGPANSNLSALGFDDNTEDYKKALLKLRGSDTRYN